MSAIAFPEMPDVPADRRAVGTVPLRFEDITQDGRLALEAMSPALGEVVWRKLLWPSDVIRALRDQGMVAILSRLVAHGGDGPFDTFHPIDASGTYAMGHVLDASGAVERIVIDMWIEATLPIGRNYGPPPDNARQRVRAGRMFGEHVLTRLFAPPDQRKVAHFEVNGAPMHGAARAWTRPESIATLPPGAVALDAGLRVDPTPIAFGLAHTDSNQHVNSLVYPRLFEDAAMRRFLELGKLKPPVLARHVEAAFRKPCFAGEPYAVALQAFTLDGKLGAIGAFLGRGDATEERLPHAKPHCFVRMLFD